MHVSEGLRTGVPSSMIVLLSSFSLVLVSPVSFSVGAPEEEYTYYGVVPANIYRYRLVDEDDRGSGWQLSSFDAGINTTIANSTLLTIVSSRDDTNVRVYDLVTDELVSEGNLGELEKLFVTLANGTIFKVVSDKPASVLLLNRYGPPAGVVSAGPLPHTFHASVDGSYVGKEFVFVASQSTTDQDYTVLALETSDVTITREDGDQRQYSLEANSHRFLMLRSFQAYRIESTGNIMVQSGTILERGDDPIISFYVPCAEGGFVGKTFYARSTDVWDIMRDYGYRISSLEDAEVTVYNLVTKEVINELSIGAGGGIGFMPIADVIAVRSDEPITLSMVHNGSIEQMSPYAGGTGGIYSGYGIGTTFVGVQPDQDTPIFLPVDSDVEAYIFAGEDTQVTIDGFLRTIEADSYILYTQPGTHTIRSDKNVVVQVNHWPLEPENQGLQFSGTAIPCIQTVSIVPDVTLTPLGESFPMMYVIIGVAAVAIAAVAGFFVMRSRARKPT